MRLGPFALFSSIFKHRHKWYYYQLRSKEGCYYCRCCKGCPLTQIKWAGRLGDGGWSKLPNEWKYDPEKREFRLCLTEDELEDWKD